MFSGNDTPIKTLTSDIDFRNGRVGTPNLKLVSDHYTVNGRGTVGLNSQIDLDAVMLFHPDLAAALAKSIRELRRLRNRDGTLSVPLSISGVLPRVLVVPDLKKLLELGAVRVIEDKAGEFLGELLGGTGRKGKKDRQRGLLDGLLGGR